MDNKGLNLINAKIEKMTQKLTLEQINEVLGKIAQELVLNEERSFLVIQAMILEHHGSILRKARGMAEEMEKLVRQKKLHPQPSHKPAQRRRKKPSAS